MNYLGKLTMFFVLFAFMVLSGAFAQKLQVTGTPPQTDDDMVNTLISYGWNGFLNEVNNALGKIDAKPEDLIKAFATASVYASHGAAQRGYGEPKLFAFTIGPIVGVKVGSKLCGIRDYISDAANEIQDNGDVTLGLNVQALSGQFILNTSRWLVDGLDLGIRFGGFKLNSIEDFGLSTLSFGLVANYQIVKGKILVPVLVKWRGVSLGSGLIYQNTKMSYAIELHRISTYITNDYRLTVDPKTTFDMKTNTVTIPLEATTAVQLFSFLNIPLGLGMDIAFGNNNMSLSVDGDVNVVGVEDIPGQTPGSLSVDVGGKMRPQIFNFKIMTGVAFKIGPVILDIPVNLYPGKGTGGSVGVTLGFSL